MSVREVSCAEVSGRLSEVTLVDVRTPGEHALVALPGSVLLPLQELEDRVSELAPLRGKEVVVYCHHGVRSLHGAAFLNAQGIDAVSMEGGIDAWSRDIDPSVPRY